MPNPNLVSRRSGALSRGRTREQRRELEQLQHSADLAEAQVAGINRVTKRAMYETTLTSVLRARAEQIAPDGAELYAMIATAGAVESARVIGDMNQRR